MNRDALISGWIQSYADGKFLIPKHDHNDVTTVYAKPRTILSAELHSNLGNFLTSGSFNINVYTDTRYPMGSGFFEVIPVGTPPYNVAGSGVAPGVTADHPSGDYDRLVVVWGMYMDWHCHAEKSAWIQSQIGQRFQLSGVL